MRIAILAAVLVLTTACTQAPAPEPAATPATVEAEAGPMVGMANPAAVADYRAGKAQAVGFLVGQVMKATGGQANAAMVQAAVRERLDTDRPGED